MCADVSEHIQVRVAPAPQTILKMAWICCVEGQIACALYKVSQDAVRRALLVLSAPAPALPALWCETVYSTASHAVLPELPFIHITIHKAVVAFASLAQALVAALGMTRSKSTPVSCMKVPSCHDLNAGWILLPLHGASARALLSATTWRQ